MSLRQIALRVIVAFVLVLVSDLLVSRVQDLKLSPLLPCIYAPFDIPLSVILYGFPFSWLFQTRFVRMIGCGPILGYFSTYNFCVLGFVLNLGFYFLVLSAILWLNHKLSFNFKNDK